MDSTISQSTSSMGKAIGDATHSPTVENNTSSQSSGDLPQPTGVEKGDSGDTETDDDVRQITGFCWFLICAALYLSALMYGLDTTIAVDVQGAVIQRFHKIDKLAWIGAAFPLGLVLVILPYGFLFTIFNMKWLYIARIVLFQGGPALCGGAPNMGALIVGCVIAGAGRDSYLSGGLEPLVCHDHLN